MKERKVVTVSAVAGWAQPFNHNLTCPGDQATEGGLFWSSAVDFTVVKA